MRSRFQGAISALAVSLIITAAHAAPTYNIYVLSPINADNAGSGNAISTSGAYATGFSQRSSPAGSNPILFDVAAQTKIAAPQLANPVRAYNEAYGVNNTGIMVGRGVTTTFGSSPVPVIWTTSTAQQLPFPSASWNAGRAYAINNNSVAVRAQFSFYVVKNRRLAAAPFTV